ncbi:uncharacterized protein LOC100906703 [Galendromus occidentalis]|uniref:Uncharacterized protein LOC100906703 n=1 Tax=Galendromus occidentalis TaxID=34638 RepID=A0AAJ6QTF1_9ACAR|nr:uncharacterized protein LOC100906703 [Galendromus occidentalis]
MGKKPRDTNAGSVQWHLAHSKPVPPTLRDWPNGIITDCKRFERFEAFIRRLNKAANGHQHEPLRLLLGNPDYISAVLIVLCCCYGCFRCCCLRRIVLVGGGGNAQTHTEVHFSGPAMPMPMPQVSSGPSPYMGSAPAYSPV